MGVPLRVLIIEDSKADAELLIRELRQGGYDPIWERVDTPDAMNAALDKQAWDVILADYVMPQFSGLAALELMKAKGLDLPFIIVSGKIGEDTAVDAMKAGAHDYIVKENTARLIPAVARELSDAEVRRERKVAEEQRDRLMAQLRDVNEQLTISAVKAQTAAEREQTMREEMRKAHDDLQRRVEELTAEVTEVREELRREIDERQQRGSGK